MAAPSNVAGVAAAAIVVVEAPLRTCIAERLAGKKIDG